MTDETDAPSECTLDASPVSHSRALAPIYRTHRAGSHQLAKLDALGIDDLCGMIESGMTVREIAEALDINHSAIFRWMDGRPGYRDRYTRAMHDSAEALLDRGVRALETCDNRSGPAVNQARYIAMEWARRAAIRDPRYSERQSVELTGANGGPIQQAVVTVYVPANGREIAGSLDK